MTIVIDFTPMKAAQEDHMLDLCDLISYTITYDDYGEEVKSPVVNSGVKCGFSYARTFDQDKRVWLSTGDNAQLRLPVGTNITDVMQVDIVSGIMASGVWDVEGEPQFGNTCTMLSIKDFNV